MTIITIYIHIVCDIKSNDYIPVDSVFVCVCTQMILYWWIIIPELILQNLLLPSLSFIFMTLRANNDEEIYDVFARVK